MITNVLAGILVLLAASAAFAAENAKAPADDSGGLVWRASDTPADCPFKPSKSLTAIRFTGTHSDYHCGDTWYPSWAADGNLYSPWTDGQTDGVRCSSGGSLTTGFRTAHAVMIGDDPLKLVIRNTSPPKQALAAPYRGRYPCGSLVYNGVWYYGTYCLGPSASYTHEGFRWNWPNLGPMPGFQISRDLGKTWTPSPLSPDRPLFPEPAKFLGPVKMGAPHFVDFGKNMQHSPDGKAYLLGMGAEVDDPKPRPCIKPGPPGTPYVLNDKCDETVHLQMRRGEAADADIRALCEPAFKQVDGTRFDHANLSWITADQVYLARVSPSPETINDVKAYEFFGGHDAAGKPVWTRDFAKIRPLIEWNNHMGCVTATYVPGLKKYLMCITDGWPTVAKMTSYILEADDITGPWRMVAYMKDFGEQAYFLNFPSKFISPDGRTLWLCYSANFSKGWNGVNLKYNPPGGRYGLCLFEATLLGPDEVAARSPASVMLQDPAPPRMLPAAFFTSSADRRALIFCWISGEKEPIFSSSVFRSVSASLSLLLEISSLILSSVEVTSVCAAAVSAAALAFAAASASASFFACSSSALALAISSALAAASFASAAAFAPALAALARAVSSALASASMVSAAFAFAAASRSALALAAASAAFPATPVMAPSAGAFGSATFGWAGCSVLGGVLGAGADFFFSQPVISGNTAMSATTIALRTMRSLLCRAPCETLVASAQLRNVP